MKEKIHYKPVLTALQNIIEQTKKKADANAACTELEEKIQELLETETTENPEVVDNRLMPPPSVMPKNRKSIRRSRYKNKNDETDDEDSSDDSEEDIDNPPIVKCE